MPRYPETLWREIFEYRQANPGITYGQLADKFGASITHIRSKMYDRGVPKVSIDGRFPAITEDERIRLFWSRVEKSSQPNGCWLFTGGAISAGYGVVSLKGGRKMMGAHQFSFRLAYGPTYGLFVCHRCDVKNCVRPDHLFLGGPLSNARDLVSKGLQGKGEDLTTCKYSDSLVLEMLEYRAKTGANYSELSRKFGIHHCTVRVMVLGKLRGYLQPDLAKKLDSPSVASE